MEPDIEAAFERLALKVDHLRDCLYGHDGHEGDIVTMTRCLGNMPCNAHGEQLARHENSLLWHRWILRGLLLAGAGTGAIVGGTRAAAAAVVRYLS